MALKAITLFFTNSPASFIPASTRHLNLVLCTSQKHQYANKEIRAAISQAAILQILTLRICCRHYSSSPQTNTLLPAPPAPASLLAAAAPLASSFFDPPSSLLISFCCAQLLVRLGEAGKILHIKTSAWLCRRRRNQDGPGCCTCFHPCLQ